MKSAVVLLTAALSNLAAQATTGRAAIEGTVVNELTRELVRKAMVTLSGTTSLTAVTDSAGHFAFRQLAPGRYSLVAQSRDFPVGRARWGFEPRREIALGAGEEKRGVVLTVLAAGSIAGRVADEDDAPMSGCTVSAMQMEHRQVTPNLNTYAYAATNDKGEYRMTALYPGRYYLLARCSRSVWLPHAFLRSGPDIDPPAQMYPPQFYPGTPDCTAATRVAVAGGADVAGMDFRMTPAALVSLRGHATVFGAAGVPRNIRLTLEARDPVRRAWFQAGALTRGATGEYVFRGVLPGSYTLSAFRADEDRLYHARTTVDIGATPPEPLNLILTAVPPLSGTLIFEGSRKAPPDGLKVILGSLESSPLGQPSGGQVQKDGTFVLAGVAPGRWRLAVNGAVGFIKSVTLNHQERSPFALDIPAGGGPLNVVLSDKFAQADGEVPGIPHDAGQGWALLWPADERRHQSGWERITQVDSGGHFAFEGIAPGQYRACAVTVSEPWMVLQRLTLLKALEGRCATLELEEGERKSATLPFLTAEELRRIAESLED